MAPPSLVGPPPPSPAPYPVELIETLSTAKGLKYLIYCLILAAAARLAETGLAVAAYLILPLIPPLTNPTTDPVPIPVIALALGGIARAALDFAAVVMGLIGVASMNAGPKEYPAPHATYLRRGLGYVGLFGLMVLLRLVVNAMFKVPPILDGDMAQLEANLRTSTVIMIPIDLLAALGVYLALYSFVQALADEGDLRQLRFAAVLNGVAAVGALAVGYLMLGIFPGSGDPTSVQSIGNVLQILAVVGAYQALQAYQHVRVRVLTAQVRPADYVPMMADHPEMPPPGYRPGAPPSGPLQRPEFRVTGGPTQGNPWGDVPAGSYGRREPPRPAGEPAIPPPGSTGPTSGPWWANDPSLSDETPASTTAPAKSGK